jgi:DnaK suppressor protein
LLIHNEEQILLQVDAALERIDNGVYGLCEQCHGAISEARLEALPYTPLCIRCAQKLEEPLPE